MEDLSEASSDHGGGSFGSPEEAGGAVDTAPGRGQRAATTDIDADVHAIRALRVQVMRVCGSLPAATRADLAGRMDALSAAAVAHDTDSPAVRVALQEVLLIVGTGALATLNTTARRRLSALTGIALPGRGS
jgi:hypothetical protein